MSAASRNDSMKGGGRVTAGPIERLGTIFPADNLTAAIDLLVAVLGATPTFVDGDRWAQFDIGPTRIMLAGADERDIPSLAVKVGDLDATLARLRTAGFAADDPVTGPHERRTSVRPSLESPWAIVLYEAAPAHRPGG
ncbi:VOC family protein [Nocardia nepalensis]|uniref:VOC family protein n=1 Tax=Nocardia nepalensis TaxID=3375448 RepID=UPI003B670C90